ncbi:terpenoid cyclases/Protein prenyltransferase [Corynespora cassiicola Philippines]|uniref:Protein farnesyltransferase subunit beta n=1 Tax=Corynespora cassiicola Philippines TaxID=1448308 RepID=A0A2T2N6A6_CORCC|nr:terpenoid cyclases/Protein prenyltransferase [Corynespora cassiicola Philippines]
MASNSQPPPASRLEELLSKSRIQELSDSGVDDDDDGEYEDMGIASPEEQANIAYVKSVTSPLRDQLETDTSEAQDETLEAVLPFLEGNPNDFPLNPFGLPQLHREKHVAFLKNTLGDYPPGFAAMDAARPWLVYWSLQGLTALGHDISEFRDRVVHTFSLCQHSRGGFGGGYGQMPHLAATYAATLSLAMVGGREAYECVDRKAMWHFLGQIKQADGGFIMAVGGEEDIRGAFCALVALSLLNIPLELPPDAPARQHGLTNFLDGLGDWVSRCQTYEGGISAAPGNEAHGAYAFCGLGCLSIMGPPDQTLNAHLDLDRLVHWLSSRQCAPEGGYCGRTNKLVDGCYSHWVGSCWSIVEAAAAAGDATPKDLSNRGALARYILAAAQFKKGGLVDKPGKRPDGYHTCYNLAGLSAVQHRNVYDGRDSVDGDLGAPYRWRAEGEYAGEGVVWGEGDVVGKVHPVFAIPYGAAEECRRYFEAKKGF